MPECPIADRVRDAKSRLSRIHSAVHALHLWQQHRISWEAVALLGCLSPEQHLALEQVERDTTEVRLLQVVADAIRS